MSTSRPMLSDTAFNWLIQSISEAQTTSADLWLVDENATDAWQSLPPNLPLQIIGNRFDLIANLQSRYAQAQFNDFDCAAIPDASLERIFYRISKEKSVVHHLANQALRCLKHNGQLIIVGHKNEGIKTFIDKISAQFASPTSARKLGDTYYAVILKQSSPDAPQLDDNLYPQLRNIAPPDLAPLLSKPGQFGWNKIDAGSQLLIDTLNALPVPEQTARLTGQALDIGCGYGFLTLNAAALPHTKGIEHWVLTDNNAAAVHAAAANCAARHLSARVIAADCAQGIDAKFSLILCNPPFHQGFDVDSSLTDKFLLSAKARLAPTGTAVFVVNQFIALERKAAAYFPRVTTLASNGKFKVVQLAFV